MRTFLLFLLTLFALSWCVGCTGKNKQVSTTAYQPGPTAYPESSPQKHRISDEENYDIISEVMIDGFKGKSSPLSKILQGSATGEEARSFYEMVIRLQETLAPKGDPVAYDQEIDQMVAATATVLNGDRSSRAIANLEAACNCMACHRAHK